MRALMAVLLLATAGPSLAAEIVVTNGDTFQLPLARSRPGNRFAQTRATISAHMPKLGLLA